MKSNPNQASFRQKNPQAIINSLLAYLCTYDSYYPWYQYIANTYDNSITDFHYDETDYFEHLTNLIQDFKVTEILGYTIIPTMNSLPSILSKRNLWLIPILPRIPTRPMVLPSTYSRINYIAPGLT